MTDPMENIVPGVYCDVCGKEQTEGEYSSGECSCGGSATSEEELVGRDYEDEVAPVIEEEVERPRHEPKPKVKPLRIEKYAESLERYKEHYPENCKGKDDIEILLFRKVISQDEATAMREEAQPKIRRRAVRNEPRVLSVTKRRPVSLTKRQFEKLVRNAKKDFQNSGLEREMEDCALDLAKSLLFSNEKLVNYFNRQGVDPKHHAEALADYLT